MSAITKGVTLLDIVACLAVPISAKVPKVGSPCKGILALALQIQDYCPSYKGLQGLSRPGEDCKNSTYLVIILYSTT